MSSRDEERALTRSLFSKRDDDGTLEENLLSFIKVFEEDGGHGKTRYLMLAGTYGKVVSAASLTYSQQAWAPAAAQREEEQQWDFLQRQDVAA